MCVFAFVMRLLVSGESPRANLHPLTVSGYLSVHHCVSLFLCVCVCVCFQGLLYVHSMKTGQPLEILFALTLSFFLFALSQNLPLMFPLILQAKGTDEARGVLSSSFVS